MTTPTTALGQPTPQASPSPQPSQPSPPVGDGLETLLREVKFLDPLNREKHIQAILSICISEDDASRSDPTSDRGGRDAVIKKKLFKAGYEYDTQRLLDLSTLVGPLTFRNHSAVSLQGRRVTRVTRPKLHMRRVEGVYDINLYVGDRALRATEAKTKTKTSLLQKPKSGLSRSSSCLAESISQARKSISPCSTIKRQHAEAGRGGNIDLVNPDRPRAGFDPVYAKLAMEDSFVLPELGKGKMTGYSKRFIAMATGISFFPVEQISMLATNDFLKHPLLMIASYLEWASAMTRLAKSGLLSMSAGKVLIEVSG